MNETLFTALQYLVPQQRVSRIAGWLAETETRWIKDNFIQWFVKRYQVDLSEAQVSDLTDYQNFNAFFTRALKEGARPVNQEENAVVCPADGCISQLGQIEYGRIFQAKGQDYSLTELLGGDRKLAEPFMGGTFATVYLSPRDYHRVHMPLAGELQTMVHIPGDLFSVNDATARQVPRLFARNERVACLFQTELGPMAVVMVGAMIVASIETVWAGLVTPHQRKIQTTHYPQSENDVEPDVVALKKGAEMGRFKLGSTAIVLFGKNTVNWLEHYQAGSATRMGEKMGELVARTPIEEELD